MKQCKVSKCTVMTIGILLVALGVMGFFAGGLWLAMFFVDMGSDTSLLLLSVGVPTLVLSFFIFLFGRWVKHKARAMSAAEATISEITGIADNPDVGG